VPQPLVGGDKALHTAAPVTITLRRPPGEHKLQNTNQVLRNFQIFSIARVMKRYQNLIRKPPCMPRQTRRLPLRRNVCRRLVHCCFVISKIYGHLADLHNLAKTDKRLFFKLSRLRRKRDFPSVDSLKQYIASWLSALENLTRKRFFPGTLSGRPAVLR